MLAGHDTVKEVVAILIIKEVEYAIRILDELNKESPLSATELSERRGMPSPFIYRVLKKLETADILNIKRGVKGGYHIRADLSELTLYDVIKAFDNTFIVIECVKEEYDCTRNSESSCRIHRAFCDIQKTLQTEFQRKSLKELLDGE